MAQDISNDVVNHFLLVWMGHIHIEFLIAVRKHENDIRFDFYYPNPHLPLPHSKMHLRKRPINQKPQPHHLLTLLLPRLRPIRHRKIHEQGPSKKQAFKIEKSNEE